MKTNKYMFSKAAFSSGSGMPIAFGLNLAVLPLFANWLLTHPIESAIIIGIIYTTVSIFRLFVIDVVEDRYGLNIRPDHLISKMVSYLRSLLRCGAKKHLMTEFGEGK